MKKLLIILFSLLSTVVFSQSNFMQAEQLPLMSGTSFLTTVGSSVESSISDHLVATFNAIPSNWIDSVMKMQLLCWRVSFARDGLQDLRNADIRLHLQGHKHKHHLIYLAEFPNGNWGLRNMVKMQCNNNIRAILMLRQGPMHDSDWCGGEAI